MASLYNPSQWYWVVAGSSTFVFNSSSATFVPVADAGYLAWLALGNVPTRIASNVLLFDVIYTAGALTQAIADALKTAGGLGTFELDITDILDWPLALPAPVGDRQGAQDNLTAYAGGGQTNATKILAPVAIVTTSGAGGTDSVMIYHSAPRSSAMVINATANAIIIWVPLTNNPGTGSPDSIDGATQVTLSGNKRALFFCGQVGQWVTLLGTASA